MKILVAPDSFKGSLSAAQICNIAEKTAKQLYGDVEVIKLPMADGGEGTVDALLSAMEGKLVETLVQSPDFRPITANYGIFDGHKAVMEMAQASGLTCIQNRNLMDMNTFGTGQMLIDAMERGVDTIYLGIGGSGTNDGGIGFASALGYRFLNVNGTEVHPIPANILEIKTIDDSQVHPKLKNTKITVMCDVKNPLLGEQGATAVFGKQKGASVADQIVLEKAMVHLAQVYEAYCGTSVSNCAGAGAAGGLGAGIFATTQGEMTSGVSAILDILNFKHHLQNTDFVITGEGRMDGQSAFGKVAYGVGTACKSQNIPCYAVVGGLGDGYQTMYHHGITSIITTVDGIMSLEDAMENSETLCENAIERLLRFVHFV